MAWKGSFQGVGLVAGAKRIGEAAKGIPRYLFTVALAPGGDVVRPTTGPESMLTEGAADVTTATASVDSEQMAATATSPTKDFMMVYVYGQ